MCVRESERKRDSVCVRVRMRVRVCVCVRERERVCVFVCVFVCLCVWTRGSDGRSKEGMLATCTVHIYSGRIRTIQQNRVCIHT